MTERPVSARPGGATHVCDHTPDDLIAAARMLREHGYAVVNKTEQVMWSQWLRDSHERARELSDRELLDRVTQHLAPSRPRWLREARSWWHHQKWAEPFVEESHLSGAGGPQ